MTEINERRCKETLEKAGISLPQKEISDNKMEIVYIPMDRIQPRDDQPRKIIDQRSLKGLVASINKRGLKQPIVVTKLRKIVAGERRFRACQILGWDKMPCIIEDADEIAVAIDSIVENIQREDLTCFEKAIAATELKKKLGGTEEVASELGITQRHAQRLVRIGHTLEELPEIFEVFKRQAATVDLATAESFVDLADAIRRLRKADNREYSRIVNKLEKIGIKEATRTLRRKFTQKNEPITKAETDPFIYKEAKQEFILHCRWPKNKPISADEIEAAESVFKMFLISVKQISQAVDEE